LGANRFAISPSLRDVHMPDGGGLAVLAGVAPVLPGVRFLALSVSDAPAEVIDLVHAGASGYVTMTIEPAELGRRRAKGGLRRRGLLAVARRLCARTTPSWPG
jgi:DNA-binding NarL/FixJ family response regulator